jgi:hypothetical protein
MGRYSVAHQTPAGTDLPIINLTGSAAIRCKIAHLILGSDATPADVAGEFVIDRTTDAGTGGTALTENALDPLTVAATGAGVGGTFSAAPTDTANSNLLMIGLNQRATFQWWANPGYELMSVATAANGLMLNCTGMSSGTPNMNATLLWDE